MAYETLRARIRRARKSCDMEQALGVVDAVLNAVRAATETGEPDARGVVAVSTDEAASIAASLGITGAFPFLTDNQE